MQNPSGQWLGKEHAVAPQVTADGHAQGPVMSARSENPGTPMNAVTTVAMSRKFMGTLGSTTFG